ncbi:MAG: TIGR02757 family protein [Bacteroidetes bacterium 47-18]|nr:MAG: TIGR02757 family protein [Bacteroidetes bacterium 47-18]
MNDLFPFLEEKYQYYNLNFDIQADPIRIPRQFTRLQDIEISGFFAATIAWGNRKAIINSAGQLMTLMDHAPYDFIMNHGKEDLKRLSGFYYRTFNATDLFYFIEFFRWHYSQYDSLEDAFLLSGDAPGTFDMQAALAAFYQHFFSLVTLPFRTQKHIGNVRKNAACKRLNMFLRWMVRSDNVDFGLWKRIPPARLVCPLDVHVSTVARQLGLIRRKPDDWQTASELTATLRQFDSLDPVKYDLVLFSLGIEQKKKM